MRGTPSIFGAAVILVLYLAHSSQAIGTDRCNYYYDCFINGECYVGRCRCKAPYVMIGAECRVPIGGPLPRTCLEYQRAHPEARRDGEYPLLVNNVPTLIYCRHMSTPHPAEYVTLINDNYSSRHHHYLAQFVTSHFMKIRINTLTSTVDVDNGQFATEYNALSYAYAFICWRDLNRGTASFVVDLIGTSFAINPNSSTVNVDGYQGKIEADVTQHNNQYRKVSVSGNCGWSFLEPLRLTSLFVPGGCVDRTNFETYANTTSVVRERQANIQTRSACKEQCLTKADCFAAGWNEPRNECYFHAEGYNQKMYCDNNYTLYRLYKCGDVSAQTRQRPGQCFEKFAQIRTLGSTKIQFINDLANCQQQCLRDIHCTGVDYNTKDNECYFFYNTYFPYFSHTNTDYDQYRRIPCFDNLKDECSSKQTLNPADHKPPSGRDFDQCSLLRSACGGSSICTNSAGMYTCTCIPGFTSPTNNGKECIDINECMQQNSCGVNSVCTNTPGSFSCKCEKGYVGNEQEQNCEDVDECEENPQMCRENSVCTNHKGGATCSCITGYTSENGMSCKDINECAVESPAACGEDSGCMNTVGSFTCECNNGFSSLSGNAMDCTDIDECAHEPQLCGDNSVCINIKGTHGCECNTGYSSQSGNGNDCTDINECAAALSVCGEHSQCSNMPGNVSCQCIPHGYISPNGNGTNCKEAPPCIHNNDCVIGGECNLGRCRCMEKYTRNGTACQGVDLSTRTCSEYKHVHPHMTKDGEYVLMVQNVPTLIYCHNMKSDNPVEYLTLVEDNFSGKVDEYKHQPLITNTFKKIRFNVQTLTVDRHDTTFASDTNVEYAYASDCQRDLTIGTTYIVNLIGTKFTIDYDRSREFVNGYNAVQLELIRKHNFQYREERCAAQCGQCYVEPLVLKHVSVFDAGCVDRMVTYENTVSPGSIRQKGAKTISDCENQCSIKADCPAAKWNKVKQECYFNVEGYMDNLYCDTDYTQFRRVKCGDTTRQIQQGSGLSVIDQCFQRSARTATVGATEQASYNNLHACTKECQIDSTCTGFDYNTKENKCYFFFNGFFPYFSHDDTDYDQYFKIPCADQCLRHKDSIQTLRNRQPYINGTNCPVEDECGSNSECHAGKCRCKIGYETDGLACNDFDECTVQRTSCGVHSRCENSEGSFSCECAIGYSSGGDGVNCTDVNECAKEGRFCGDNSVCTNSKGSASCACKTGYTSPNGLGNDCTDINECAAQPPVCGDNTICLNEPRSFSCRCKQGYISPNGNGKNCKEAPTCIYSDNCVIGGECHRGRCRCMEKYTRNGTACQGADLSPRTCREYKLAYPQVTWDGEFVLMVQHVAVPIYCHNMNSNNPVEYLTLVEDNFSRKVNEYKNQPLVTNKYKKIRLNVQTLTVDRHDKTFALDKSVEYAYAGDCRRDLSIGTMYNVNLIGTEFAIDYVRSRERAEGYNTKRLEHTWNHTFQYHEQRCSGQCGWCGLEPLILTPVSTLGSVLPRTCREYKAAHPHVTEDREYALSVQHVPTLIYCHNMKSNNPKEYITLEEMNLSGKVNEYKNQPLVLNYYKKIRLNVQTSTVDRHDTTFASDKNVEYAYASDCQSDLSIGTLYFINLIGTEFAIDYVRSIERIDGYNARQLNNIWRDNFQYHEESCSGQCGWCGVDPLVLLPMSLLGAGLSRTCREYKAAHPGATQDGDYQLIVQRVPMLIYCHNMKSDNPVEYLSLVLDNYSRKVNEYKNLPLYSSAYKKIRLNIQTLRVDRQDTTFASDKSLDYAYVYHCKPDLTKGISFTINLSGTSFAVDVDRSISRVEGFKAKRLAEYWANNNQFHEEVCVGQCGWCKVDPLFLKPIDTFVAEPESGCLDRLVSFEDTVALGGVLQGFDTRTMHACEKQCGNTPGCLAAKWNKVRNQCHFHFNEYKDDLYCDKDYTQFRLLKCGDVTTQITHSAAGRCVKRFTQTATVGAQQQTSTPGFYACRDACLNDENCMGFDYKNEATSSPCYFFTSYFSYFSYRATDSDQYLKIPCADQCLVHTDSIQTLRNRQPYILGSNCERDGDCVSNSRCDAGICRCKIGYETDGVACNDFDECSVLLTSCGYKSRCENSPGSYSCTSI